MWASPLQLRLDMVPVNIGSLAALFQGAIYAGAVPAGGVFATLTSIAMTGLIPLVATVGAVIAGTGTWVALELFGQGEDDS